MIRYVDFRYARRTDRRVDRVNACTSVARWFSLWYFVLASTQCGMPSAHGLSMPRAQLFRERVFVGFESPERDKHIRRVIFIRAGVGLASPRSRDRWFYTARRVGIVGSIWSGVTILSVLMLMTKLFFIFQSPHLQRPCSRSHRAWELLDVPIPLALSVCTWCCAVRRAIE